MSGCEGINDEKRRLLPWSPCKLQVNSQQPCDSEMDKKDLLSLLQIRQKTTPDFSGMPAWTFFFLYGYRSSQSANSATIRELDEHAHL